jgi:hypothetical protein
MVRLLAVWQSLAFNYENFLRLNVSGMLPKLVRKEMDIKTKLF